MENENVSGTTPITPTMPSAGGMADDVDSRIIPLPENVQGTDYWKGKKIAFWVTV